MLRAALILLVGGLRPPTALTELGTRPGAKTWRKFCSWLLSLSLVYALLGFLGRSSLGTISIGFDIALASYLIMWSLFCKLLQQEHLSGLLK